MLGAQMRPLYNMCLKDLEKTAAGFAQQEKQV